MHTQEILFEDYTNDKQNVQFNLPTPTDETQLQLLVEILNMWFRGQEIDDLTWLYKLWPNDPFERWVDEAFDTYTIQVDGYWSLAEMRGYIGSKVIGHFSKPVYEINDKWRQARVLTKIASNIE